ncbi:MAG: outer rane transport energization protein ExbD [Candidatus Angelobacter sp.]|jgi:biopolymer transport protein ExbD|nr:outer rane transport energization protein ExbD [Candidatus Angelobacter sp.]
MAMATRLGSYNSDINVTPMVDVMLVLLIIFMVITPMLQKGVNIEMAKTKNPIAMEDADKEDAVLIAVERDGQVYFDTEKVNSPAELTTKVQDKLSNRQDKKIYIRADARAKYGKVVEVVDDVRAAGVDQVGLLTEQIQKPGQQGATPPPPAAPGK